MVSKSKIQFLKSLFFNWKTNKKVIVIESDDWGSMRMPSLSVYELLSKKGVVFSKFGFELYDNLASRNDLQNLFEVCSTVIDKNNNHPIITAGTIVTNPDFSKIGESLFEKYYYELFTETLNRYYPKDNVFEMWQLGIKNAVFWPQFHGREHINVQMWLKLLRNKHHGAKLAFENNIYTFNVAASDDIRIRNTQAYNVLSDDEIPFVEQSIQEGLKLFENIFGFKSLSAIAPSYTWDDFVEKKYFECGVKYIQGTAFQVFSELTKNNTGKNGRYNYQGKKNQNSQRYLTRNVFFEPSLNPSMDIVQHSLKRISLLFRLKSPVIISTHRVNFIGSHNLKKRDANLILFKELLNKIVEKWPDVEFITSDQLGLLMDKQVK